MRYQDDICSLGIEPFSTSVTYMCMYIYICIYIYVYIFVCSMPHTGVLSIYMGHTCAYVYVFSCVHANMYYVCGRVVGMDVGFVKLVNVRHPL